MGTKPLLCSQGLVTLFQKVVNIQFFLEQGAFPQGPLAAFEQLWEFFGLSGL